MQFQELSLQQIGLLDNLKVSTFIGAQGANFIEQNIRIANYDPQTALVKLYEAVGILSSVNDRFIACQQSLDSLGLDYSEAMEVDRITIRLGFRKEASINNVSD